MLQATLRKRLGPLGLEVTFDCPAGQTLVLVGESGAGKTTLLRLLAGLVAPDAGRITLDGECWFDSAGQTARPAWRRSVGYLPQDYALFPHLSAFDNIAYGLRAQRQPAPAVRSRVEAVLTQLGVSNLASRRPAQLSGGQQQRVALARALVLEPKLLLLDEPLAALDLQTRRTVRMELRRLLAALPCVTVFVTHSPMEAMVFGNRIAVLEGGRLEQVGARDELLRRPRSAYVAEFLGLNLLQGRILARDASGMARLETLEGTLSVVDPGGDKDVFVAVNPREITLSLEPPAGSAQNVFHGVITELVPEPPGGERVRVALGTHPPLVAEVTRAAVERLELREGVSVYAAFKATGVMPYR